MTSYTKEEIVQKTENIFKDTIEWLSENSEEYNNTIWTEGKWSASQHIFHLVKSTKAVSKGMKLPKLALQGMFGKNNREERGYNQLEKKYKEALASSDLKAPAEFSSAPDRKFSNEEIIDRFEAEKQDFLKALSKWNEKDMSKYVMPHPAIGKCTVREMCYFTILHTNHHLDILKEKYTNKA